MFTKRKTCPAVLILFLTAAIQTGCRQATDQSGKVAVKASDSPTGEPSPQKPPSALFTVGAPKSISGKISMGKAAGVKVYLAKGALPFLEEKSIQAERKRVIDESAARIRNVRPRSSDDTVTVFDGSGGGILEIMMRLENELTKVLQDYVPIIAGRMEAGMHRTVNTDDLGQYSFPDLEDGTYTIFALYIAPCCGEKVKAAMWFKHCRVEEGKAVQLDLTNDNRNFGVL